MKEMKKREAEEKRQEDVKLKFTHGVTSHLKHPRAPARAKKNFFYIPNQSTCNKFLFLGEKERKSK